jgi:hypothetical protein
MNEALSSKGLHSTTEGDDFNGSTPVLSLGRPFAAFVLASICADKKIDLTLDLQQLN